MVLQCSFLSTTKPFGYVMYILSRTNLGWEMLLQHPSDAILKLVYTNVIMILKESFHEIVQNVSLKLILFFLHKSFGHKLCLATFHVPSEVTFNLVDPLWPTVLALLETYSMFQNKFGTSGSHDIFHGFLPLRWMKLLSFMY